MKKRLIALLVCLVMVMMPMLAACGGGGGGGEEAPAADEGGVKVGLITLHDENSTYDLNFINAAKEAVRTAIDHIKNFLNFHWELPHLALPHFSISGSINPMDWFTQGVPHISVDWYKKAYNNPIMFTKPTVLQTPSGYKGFGDGAGAEVVMGLNKLKDIAGETNIQINVYGAEGQNVNQLAAEIERRLVKMQNQRTAVWA